MVKTLHAPRPTRIVVAITGASGAVYGLAALRMLRNLGAETHLVMSKSGALTCWQETGLSRDEVLALADVGYRNEDIGAAVASGSFQHAGMLVAPCSMKSLAEIASGVCGSLVSRAADVTLKERRRLVLMARETPLTLGHIENMSRVTAMGAIVCPPVPSFYAHPTSIEDMVSHTVGRVLDLFGFDAPEVLRWNGVVRTPTCANQAGEVA